MDFNNLMIILKNNDNPNLRRTRSTQIKSDKQTEYG